MQWVRFYTQLYGWDWKLEIKSKIFQILSNIFLMNIIFTMKYLIFLDLISFSSAHFPNFACILTYYRAWHLHNCRAFWGHRTLCSATHVLNQPDFKLKLRSNLAWGRFGEAKEAEGLTWRSLRSKRPKVWASLAELPKAAKHSEAMIGEATSLHLAEGEAKPGRRPGEGLAEPIRRAEGEEP